MASNSDYCGIYDHCYIGSDTVHIASQFKDYTSLLKNSSFDKHYEIEDKTFIINAIGTEIDDEKYELLADFCNIDHLTVEGEIGKVQKATYEWCKDPVDPLITDNTELQTISYTKRRNLLKYHQVRLKYRTERPIMYESSITDNPSPTLIPESDILIFVRVYVPFTSRHKQSSGALGKLSINFVIAMHGSQTLDKLRDTITCVSDHSISIETSSTPSRHKTENAKDVYKSGFFFIEDTFYNDFRDPKNKDNSKFIREWAESRKLGPYKFAKMEETRVDSLCLRFGFPWVYQHQGDCEHLISFSDARLVNPTDELNADYYPRIVRIKPRPNRYCMTCGIYNVTWVTMNNTRLPHNPCLFCDSCFKSYNYIKGQKVGNFKAYPYPYDSELLQPQLVVRTKPPTLLPQNSTEENSNTKKVVKSETVQMDTS